MPSFDLNPDDNNDDFDWNEWDRVKINSFVFEELKVEVDADLGNDIDVKKAPGADGATATNRGYEPCKPKLTWELRTRRHWDTYKELLAAVQPKPGKQAPSIVTVEHPQLVILKKQKFIIVKIHTLKKTGPQLMTAQFDLLEYFPSPKAIPGTAPLSDGAAGVDKDGERIRADHFGFSDKEIDKRQKKLLADDLPSNSPKPRKGIFG